MCFTICWLGLMDRKETHYICVNLKNITTLDRYHHGVHAVKKIHIHIFWSIPSFNKVFNSIITHMLLRWILVTDTGKTNKKDGYVAHYFKCILCMKVEMEYIIEYLLKYCTKLIFPVGYFCQIIVVKKISITSKFDLT